MLAGFEVIDISPIRVITNDVDIYKRGDFVIIKNHVDVDALKVYISVTQLGGKERLFELGIPECNGLISDLLSNSTLIKDQTVLSSRSKNEN